MADASNRPARRFHRGCALWLAGEFVASLVGLALAFFVVQANAPGWVFPLVFFGPPVLFTLIMAGIYLPPLLRDMREQARNAPSPESVAAVRDSTDLDASEIDVATTVPTLATEPGRVLAHSLPRADLSPGCKFGCTVGMTLFWNGIVSIFVFNLWKGWNVLGWFRWLYAAFLTPFVIVGLVLVVAVIVAAYKWFVSWFVGRVEVELSAHPLVPGGTARARVAQRGLVPLRGVMVSLVCTEEATYVAGTSTATDKHEVARHRLADPDDHPGGLPLEFEFTVPADAMHSFEAKNNRIKWTVLVTGRAMGLPFRDDYSAIVSPE